MIIVFIILMLYPIFIIGILIPLNQKGLLPGTWKYKQRRQIEDVKFQVEVSRLQTINSHYRMKEDEMLSHRMKELEAPKV